MKLRELLSPLPRSPVSLRLGHAAGLTVPRTVIQYRVAASLPPGGRLRVGANYIVSAADFVQIYNFAYKKGIFYLNQFALVIEFLQTFSIKYSFFLFMG